MFKNEPDSKPGGDPIGRYNGAQLMLPQDMSIPDAMATLEAMQDSAGTEFSRTFKYRPYDGAHALQCVLEREYGTKGIATGTMTMFGKKPPRRVSVPIGPGSHVSVPWDEVTLPALGGSLTIGSVYEREFGYLFNLVVTTQAAREADAERVFDLVEAELQVNSIYRGKAIDGNSPMPDFLTLDLDPDQVVYNAQTTAKLEANLWVPLTQLELMRELGLPIKRSVLLEGDFGTGKTTAALVSGQKAVENGWTFIYCRPQDEYREVMTTARLYAPAVVFMEDIDRLMEDGDPEAMTEILDVFDGLKAKSTEIVVIATTNHRDKIHKGMFRPGRLDSVLTIGSCDADGVERLLTAVVKPGLLEGVEMDTVAGRLQGMTPAFVREAADRAVRYAVARVAGKPTSLITEDFIKAAAELSEQKALMDGGIDDKPAESLDEALSKVIRESIQGVRVAWDSRGTDQYLEAENMVPEREQRN